MRLSRLPLLFTLTLLPFCCVWAQGTITAPTAQTTCGAVQGQHLDTVSQFLGIPFAAPPVSDLRFQPPRPPQPWTTARAATQFPPPCPQQNDDGAIIGNEDCLYLNVWTPATTGNRLVLFFLHGGANIQGSTSVQFGGKYLYDGAALARTQDVVVVTAQYRLGALGFLAHPALGSPSGNYAIYDQLLALEWVRSNIRAFGGDAGRVMLFGESAGAVNTCVLLSSPLAKGLFTGALMQSGVCRATSQADAQAQGTTYANTLGCTSAQCLRNASVAALIEAQKGGGVQPDGSVATPFSPTVDGKVLPAMPLDTIRQGQHNHVPFVIGANADETAAWTLPLTANAYRATVIRLFGPLMGSRILEQYPASAYASPREALVAVTTDVQFVCPARTIASAVAEAQREPVYRYFFTKAPTDMESGGAFHGLELAYVFQQFATTSTPPPSAVDLSLQRSIGEYWTNFAATGDPNGAGEPAWPRYVPALDPYLEFGVPVKACMGVRTAQCDFWDRMAQLAGRN